MHKLVVLSALWVALVSGCLADEGDGGLSAEASQDVISLNGTTFNGIALVGTTPAGGTLTGSTLLGAMLTGTSASGTAITASTTTTAPLTGLSVVGSTWTGASSSNVAVKLRVDAATQGTGGNADLWFVSVAYQTAAGWSPLCGLDATQQPIQAVSIAGTWTSTAGDTASYGPSTKHFTLACRGNSIAKCVELGYKPHKGFANQLAACVRMLRADYCGTGVAHTVTGTSINAFDNVGILADNQAWAPEAEWTPSGARCVSSTNNTRYELVHVADPSCVKPPKTATCGTTFGNGALLIDELNPN